MARSSVFAERRALRHGHAWEVIHTVAVVRALNYRDRYQLGYAIDHVVPDRTGRRLTGPRG
jgi:hypothetical protein